MQRLEEKVVTKFSSAGLIYKYFGLEVVDHIAKNYEHTLDQSIVERLHRDVYRGLIQEIDAIDNGIDLGGAQRYRITTGLSERVSVLNSYQTAEDMCQSTQFKVAMKMCERDLCHKIHTKIFKQLASYEIVQNAFNDRLKIHPTGEVIYLERGCSWKSNLSQIEDDSEK